ncbi:uncharacterized protein LOC111380892 [Olea europaea var. sylvestris]|uniref:uncharacterized protein LOC111380892 n=1 Tax=Olea europaea var. sylvestris TaxID=158386 RepID=UPI000C1D3FB2|nr:uncharacterized protein LOC111380892 [Olea europaea var. sylvestris]
MDGIATNSYQWPSECLSAKKVAGLYEGFNNQASERKQSLEDILGTFISETRSRFNKDEKGKFPNDTEVNPREHFNAIVLRSGKVVEDRKPRDPIFVEEKQTEGYLKKEFDEKFTKFLEVFKKIHINIPFAESLAQIPDYTKFLNNVMSKKKKLEEFEIVKLTEECSAILQMKLPHKLKDLGRFNIQCNIGGITFDRAMCDLGASINLMPLSVFKKLGLGEVKSTPLPCNWRIGQSHIPRALLKMCW